jgi:hypothetical protein
VASRGLSDVCSSLEEPTVPIYSLENGAKGGSFKYIRPAVPVAGNTRHNVMLPTE